MKSKQANTKTRKEIRKDSRKAKKAKKHEFFSKKKPHENSKGKPNIQNNAAGKKFGVSPKNLQWKKSNEPGKFVKAPKKRDLSWPDEECKINENNNNNNNNNYKNKINKKKQLESLVDQQNKERLKEKMEKNTLDKQMQQKRIQHLKADNLKVDKEIKKLEKRLKLKGKSVPKSFALDGLDYLLQACDKDHLDAEASKNIQDSDSEFEDDFATITGKAKTKSLKETSKEKNQNTKKHLKKSNKISKDVEEEEESDKDMLGEEDLNGEQEESDKEISNDEEATVVTSESEDNNLGNKDDQLSSGDEDDDLDSDDQLSIEDDGQSDSDSHAVDKTQNTPKKRKIDDTTSKPAKKRKNSETSESDLENEVLDDNSSDNEENGNNKSIDKFKTSGLWEDIYGRTRDIKGNVINAYKPPQLRKVATEGTNEKIIRLKRQLKGLLNRLSENNIANIASQIENLYMSNSRNDMNETLCQLLNEALIVTTLTPERLVAEHAMLIVVLHANVGSEIGAHCLQYMVTQFDKMLQENPAVEDKRVNNLLLFITNLYNFKLFHSLLMYDIINQLLEKVEEKQVELLLMTLRTVGFTLRKDDPVALKSLILKVQDLTNQILTDDSSSRVKFMLETLQAIKNNNMSKIPNYNPELVEHMKKNLKILIRKGNYNTELKISLQDLLKAEEHGRWWIVGSAWTGPLPGELNQASSDGKSSAVTEFSQNLLDLARKQRMNTDVRRNVFCILMSAEDFLDAFEKLIRLKLKGAVEREIMNVLLHCALQEKQFNPYYFHLANKFSIFDRKYQVMIQCAIWDKMKDLKNLLPMQITNLAKLVGNIVLEKGLPISVLKVIEFADLDKPSVRFIRQVLLTILLSSSEGSVEAVFKRITQSAKLKEFREGLRLFLHHFVLRNTKHVPQDEVSRLTDMIHVADKALSSSDSKTVF